MKVTWMQMARSEMRKARGKIQGESNILSMKRKKSHEKRAKMQRTNGKWQDIRGKKRDVKSERQETR